MINGMSMENSKKTYSGVSHLFSRRIIQLSNFNTLNFWQHFSTI